MAEYPIHPYIIHCLEPLLANAAAPVVLALDGRCGSGKTTMAAALAEQFPDSIVLHTDDFYLPPAQRAHGWEQTPCANGVWESPHTVASKLESKEEFPQG